MKKNPKCFPVCFINATGPGQPMILDSRPATNAASRTFHNSRAAQAPLQGSRLRGGEAGPGFEPRARSGEVPPGLPLGTDVPGPPPEGRRGTRAAKARREGRVGAGSGPRRVANPPRPPPRRRGGSRTYRVGLLRGPGITKQWRRRARRGGGPAGDGGRRAEEGDARPVGRPQPLPGSLTPGVRRPRTGHTPSVRLPQAQGVTSRSGNPGRGRVGEQRSRTRSPVRPRASRAAPRRQAPPPPPGPAPGPAPPQAPPPSRAAGPGRPPPPPGWRFLFPHARRPRTTGAWAVGGGRGADCGSGNSLGEGDVSLGGAPRGGGARQI